MRSLLITIACAWLTFGVQAQNVSSAPPQWPQREHPGELPMDLWGWDYSSEHYRYVAPFHAGAKEARTVMGQSSDWGANTVDICYGFYTIGNDALTGGDGTDPVAGSARGQGYWTLKENLDFNAELHRRGMTIHWIPNSMWLQRPDFTDFFKTMEGIASDQMDALHQPWEQMLDGMGMEQMWLFPPGVASRLFQAYNPGAYVYFLESAGWKQSWPNVMYGLATGGGAQDEITVGERLGRGVPKTNGMETMISQIEAIEYVGLDAQCSLARPDWVQKSLHDTLRPSFMDPRNKTYTALWYVMAPNLAPNGKLAHDGGLSPESAHRAQAMTIDPIRSAWAGKLDATGADGRKEFFRRSDLPSSTGYLQNNFLRLHIFAEKSGGELLYDPSRTAHFSEQGAPLVLADDFLETVSGPKPMTLDLNPLQMTFEQPGGFFAQMQTQARWISLASPIIKSEETRTYSTISDSPFLRVQTDFLQYSQPTSYGSRLKIALYDQLETADQTYTSAATIDLPSTCVLSASAGNVPSLALLIESTKPTKLNFAPKQSLTLEYAPAPRKHKTDVIALVLDGLYTRQDLGTLASMLREEPEERQLEASQTQKVENPYPLPMVKILKVNGIHERPYLVEENGWWMTRGAQLCDDDSNAAYLKLYLPPSGSAQFRPFDFIAGSVKPGWGCQYTLAIRDVKPNPASLKPAQTEVGTSCTVQVLRVTPMLFAPRVQIGHEIAGVRLDGKPWHYFDDTMVYLPNRPGTYQLEVSYGHAETPHITRTMAVVDATEWDGHALKITAALPVWLKSMPEDSVLTASVEHPGHYLSATQACGLLRMTTATASLVRFDGAGQFSLDFDNPHTPGVLNAAPQPIGVQNDLAAYLSREQARDVQPWLAGRPAELVDLADVAAGRVDLSRYGALIYNQFYLDEIPEPLKNESVLQPLRTYLNAGGGLLLLSRAAPLANLLGIETAEPSTPYLSPHSLNYTMQAAEENGYGFVPRAGEAGHPLFAGLKPLETNWLPIASHDMMSAIRGRGWSAEAPAQNARILADFRLDSTRPHDAPPVMPALLEWQIGRGRVVDCSFNLFWTFSDRQNWLAANGPYPLSDAQVNDPMTAQSAVMANNGILFMRNAMGYLGAGETKPIGLLSWSAR